MADDGSAERMRAALIRIAQDRARERLATYAKQQLISGLAAAVGSASTVYSGQVRGIVNVFERSMADRSQFRKVHEEVGEAARRSAAGSYDQLITARKTVPSYRKAGTVPGKGRLVGAMSKALRTPGDGNVYVAYAEGLEFPNAEFLDREAAHWFRLNFGASPGFGRTRGRRPQGSFPIRFSNIVAGELSFKQGPSPRILEVPPGRWVEGALVKVGKGAKKPSDVGIAGQQFLDAGLRTIAKQLPAAYLDLYKDWYNEARRYQSGPLSTVVKPTRPYRRVTGAY